MGDHSADSDAGYIIEDLVLRAQTADPETYRHVNAKELTMHYHVKGGMVMYADLNTLLEAANFRRAKVKGKTGFWVPNYEVALTAAQRASLNVITGGLDEPKGGQD